jgi:5-methylcytosine-specific restriction protein A
MPRPNQWQVCSYDNCPTLVKGNTRCPKHPTYKTQRASGSARGWTKQWATFSKAYLQAHRWCECTDCLTIPWADRPIATDVDHGNGHSRTCPHAYDERWLTAMAHSHHSRKTATEDGGFTGSTQRCQTPTLPQKAATPRRGGGTASSPAPL